MDKKEAKRLYAKAYYEKNKEALRLKNKACYEKNKEALRLKHKEYREKNKDKIKAKKDKNKDAVKIYMKAYGEKNKDKLRAYYEKNKDKINEYSKEYRLKNKPKPEDKYKTGKIYKIIDNTCNKIYIGSTIQSLNSRMYTHIYNNSCSSKIITDNNDYTVELIEDYPCDNEKQLLLREQYHLDLHRSRCVNKNKTIKNKFKKKMIN
tara:strand:+ start:1490 stop:2107 length:618 start_codon:yes stop_codon:yes gene_type:complete